MLRGETIPAGATGLEGDVEDGEEEEGL